ncbi:MAG: fasciclin domain-containing protein [Bacteroidales bacterium]|nr:fasciclin domain-containing protein [Bacteroidales bacterium]MBN2697191.1 fasciclin domain-containing protein [Bacteroidales bacterium]
MNKTVKQHLLLLGTLLALWGCENRWEEHTRLNPGVAEANLMELISNHPDLSEFETLIISAGLDEMLESSRSFTVWAPTNSAMAQVPDAILSDTATLSMFVRNHISFGTYSYYGTGELQKVKTYSGKNIIIDNASGKVEDASLIEPYDVTANNGVLHMIDQALTPAPNTWDIIETTSLCPVQTEYLNSMTGMVFDPSAATILGVDPVTGKPIYDTLSGMVWSNSFLAEVRDLKNEDLLSTLILLEDEVFESEYSKFRRYFVVSDSLKSNDLTRWHICRDLVFPGIMTLNEVPDTLVSLYHIKIPFDRNAVRETIETSNGIVYVLSHCDVRLQDKIPTIIVEGEDTTKFVFTAVDGQTGFTRQKQLASGGYDFLLDNHRLNPGYINYYIGKINSCRYRFYWKAVNDFNGSYRNPNSSLVLQQRLYKTAVAGYDGSEIIWAEANPISIDLIPVNDSTYETAVEVNVGQQIFTTYQDLWLQVRGGGSNMTITLDYLKVVPVFE